MTPVIAILTPKDFGFRLEVRAGRYIESSQRWSFLSDEEKALYLALVGATEVKERANIRRRSKKK